MLVVASVAKGLIGVLQRSAQNGRLRGDESHTPLAYLINEIAN